MSPRDTVVRPGWTCWDEIRFQFFDAIRAWGSLQRSLRIEIWALNQQLRWMEAQGYK